MALESVTHISDLVITNPTSTDPKSEGDNHLRNIKTALKTDFPNISGPVTKTHTQLNNALDKTGDTMTGGLNIGAGNLLVTGGGGLGYGVGSGGDVAQATSKTTDVTLNKPCGRIIMNNAALAAGGTVEFSFNNTFITGADGVLVTGAAFGARYEVTAVSVTSGIVTIRVTNVSGASQSDALVITFQVIKGATS